jgi:hypothetical protein
LSLVVVEVVGKLAVVVVPVAIVLEIRCLLLVLFIQLLLVAVGMEAMGLQVLLLEVLVRTRFLHL